MQSAGDFDSKRLQMERKVAIIDGEASTVARQRARIDGFGDKRNGTA